MSLPPLPDVRITLPAWTGDVIDLEQPCASDEERMRVAITCARENVLRDTGGPFGAAVFDTATGRIVAVGVNRVVPLNNSSLHAEVVALMIAQAVLGTWTLQDAGAFELFTSCEPCAMCLGAAHWSGVTRVVYSALRDDARSIDFDEGPVFPQSYEYLRERGMTFTEGVLREDGRAVLRLYRDRGGPIYNG